MPDAPGVGEWLRGTGSDSDIVISSRIRLARNVVGFPLKARLGNDDASILCEHLRRRIQTADLAPGMLFQSLDQMNEIDRLVLVESHIISLEQANAEGVREVVRDSDGSVALMLNEEDHLRMQTISSGLELDDTFRRSKELESSLQDVLDFAFHPRFGYLTSCPTNVGTGMRVSVMLHLPALVFTKQIDKVFNSVAKMNLAVRGFYGEGTKALSDLYQISNQVTLGRAPETLLDDIRRVLPKIISFERDVRNQVLQTGRVAVEDRVCRALGILRSARTMSSEEAFELLSMVRMGVHLGILDDLPINSVNHLFMISQPGHLQASQGGKPLDPSRRDTVRARIIREHLGGS